MHFALVHGAYHGAWCWDLLRRELEQDGHSTSAVDLPCEDPDAGAARYADVVVKAIPKGIDGVVLVGHSLAGLTIPVAASMTPTLMTVYLCALVPVPGLSFDAQDVHIGTGFQASEPAIANADGSASMPVSRATQEVTPLREWPAAGSAYILCTEDRMVSSDYSRRAARGVLGIEPTEMRGGHSPFLSRPRELAAILVGLVSG